MNASPSPSYKTHSEVYHGEMKLKLTAQEPFWYHTNSTLLDVATPPEFRFEFGEIASELTTISSSNST